MQIPEFLSDVTIMVGAVAQTLPGATAAGVLWQAAPGRFWLSVPGVARYEVLDGSQIIVDPLPGVDEARLSQFLLRTPLAALLYQRGLFAFHAAACVPPIDGARAVLLAGDSGAGKSTLLAALLKRGWQILADDLTAVLLDTAGNLVVPPIDQQVVLWPDAAEHLAQPGQFPAATPITILPSGTNAACPLGTICWLSVHSRDELSIEAIQGGAFFGALGTLSYNSHIAAALFDPGAYFHLATAIVRRASLQRLRRPRGRWCIDALADRVEGLAQ
jgi:hypothetical protein